ncbi:MAG: disulfide bond formation protein B [Alphaproteobacteria bacterium]|nr:disulfide bond formation protein B [Alphaproteobacteria bacterium]
MLTSLSPRNAALLIFAGALVTIVGAWIFEYCGYLPCELCLMQRWAYYAAIPLAGLIAFLPEKGFAMRAGLVVLALIWLSSGIFGVYHSGVEWDWWQGPTACTGDGGLSDGVPDLAKPVVMCDEPAIRIFGLSLAGWNAVISAVLAILAVAGARHQGSSSVSQ